MQNYDEGVSVRSGSVFRAVPSQVTISSLARWCPSGICVRLTSASLRRPSWSGCSRIRGGGRRHVLCGSSSSSSSSSSSGNSLESNLHGSFHSRDSTQHGMKDMLVWEASTMLNMQYRMHPSIRSFPSSQFYDSKLEDSVSIPHRPELPLGGHPKFRQG